MRRTKAVALLGLVLAGAESAFGLGAIEIGNYQPPYNPVVWASGVPTVGGRTVRSTDGVQLQLWYGRGILDEEQLTQGPFLPWDTTAESNGYAGYYGFTTVLLLDWEEGDTYTFQVRPVSELGWFAEIGSRSALWTENSMIEDVSGSVLPPPGRSRQSIGFTLYVIPEPSSCGLVVLGSAALIRIRMRNSKSSEGRRL